VTIRTPPSTDTVDAAAEGARARQRNAARVAALLIA
jgi:hypothetical protein